MSFVAMEELVFSKGKRMKGNLSRLKEIDDDDRNLFNLFKAILNVDCKYVDRDVYHERLERVFAYELYHQWSKLLDRNKNDYPANEKYILNGETRKTMGYFQISPEKINSYPDLVLHKSIEKPNCQAIVCEIKRRGNFTKSGFEEDIKKLKTFVCALQNEYTFNYGVFILVGDKMKSIFEKINSLHWTKRRVCNKSEKILLAAYDGLQLQIVSLRAALDKREREQYINYQR